MEKTHQLIDKIYAAALTPSEWPSVVQSLQSLFNAHAAGIYTLDTTKNSITQLKLQGIDESYINSYRNYFVDHNPWTRVNELQNPGKIRTDQSLDQYYNTPGLYRKTDYFNEWLEPQDFYYSLGTNLLSHDNINTKFCMYRPKLGRSFSKQNITTFRHLSRHMMRSMEMTQRLAIRDSQLNDVFHLIDRLNFGIVFLDERLAPMQINHAANDIVSCADGLNIKNGSILASHKADDEKLSSLVQSALEIHRGQRETGPCSINVYRPSGKRPYCVNVFPLPQHNHSFPESAAVILFISDPEQAPVVPVDYLQQRYHLTLSEARLTQYLCKERTLKEAAEHAGLSYETARGYLKIVFQKTGARRQAELLRLLLSDQVFIAH